MEMETKELDNIRSKVVELDFDWVWRKSIMLLAALILLDMFIAYM
jgi:hypothetical protein